jgi:hypothetical protein
VDVDDADMTNSYRREDGTDLKYPEPTGSRIGLHCFRA